MEGGKLLFYVPLPKFHMCAKTSATASGVYPTKITYHNTAPNTIGLILLLLEHHFCYLDKYETNQKYVLHSTPLHFPLMVYMRPHNLGSGDGGGGEGQREDIIYKCLVILHWRIFLAYNYYLKENFEFKIITSKQYNPCYL